MRAQTTQALPQRATASAADRWTPQHRRTLRAAADTLIPSGKLPGAVQAGVPIVLEQVIRHWMAPAERQAFIDGLAQLDVRAIRSHGKPFASCTAAQREAQLQGLRAEQPYRRRAVTLVGRLLDPELPFYLRLRDLVLFCYFNSEAGATQATRYVPVPGSYQGDVPMASWPHQMVL